MLDSILEDRAARCTDGASWLNAGYPGEDARGLLIDEHKKIEVSRREINELFALLSGSLDEEYAKA